MMLAEIADLVKTPLTRIDDYRYYVFMSAISLNPKFLNEDEAAIAAHLRDLAAWRSGKANRQPNWRLLALPITEASRRTQTPESTVRWLCHTKKIRAEKRGRDWWVCMDDLQRMLDEKSHRASVVRQKRVR